MRGGKKKFAGWAVAAVVFLAYLPALKCRFVDWDDYGYLLATSSHWGLSWSSLKWMFGTFSLPHYYPLTWLSLSIDKALFGLAPWGFHLTNNLLHAACAAVFFSTALQLLGGNFLAAGFAALAWALHPLRVEGVAWVTERSNVLSALFYLLSIRHYLMARRRRDWSRHLSFSLAFFAASLLSKAQGLSLPASLVALDFFLGRFSDWRQRREVVKEKVLYLVLAVPFALLACGLQYFHRDLMWSMEKVGLGRRLEQSAYGLAFYLWKTVVPLKLLPLYIAPRGIPAAEVAAAALAVGALFALGVRWRRSRPWLLAAQAHYAAALLPTLGLVKVGAQIAADRYCYLPSLSWALLAGAGAAVAAKRWRAETIGLCAAILLALTTLTWTQISIWSGGDSVWTALAAADPGNPQALEHLALERTLQGRLDEAAALLEESLRSDPDFGAAHNALGNVRARQGKFDQAVAEYREALRCSAGHPTIHYNMAVVLERQGKSAEAADEYRAELRVAPGHEASLSALARVSAR